MPSTMGEMAAPGPRISRPGVALLFAGPIAIAVAVVALVAGRGWFEHGPGVPTAGRSEAWSLIWGCWLLAGLGHLTSTLAVLVQLATRWRLRQSLPRAVWGAVAYHLLVVGPFLWLWFST